MPINGSQLLQTDGKRELSMDELLLEQYVERFLEQHPEGFNSPGWRSDERYKLSVRQDFRGDDRDGIDILFDAINNVNSVEFCKRLLAVFEDNKMRFNKGHLTILAHVRGGAGGGITYSNFSDLMNHCIGNEEDAEFVHDQFKALLSKKVEYIEKFRAALTPLIQKTKRGRNGESKCPFFLPSFFLGIYYLNDEIIIKPTLVSKLANKLEYGITIGQEMKGYLNAKQFFKELSVLLTKLDMPPNDNIDIQGFVHKFTEEVLPPKRYWLFNLYEIDKWEYSKINKLAMMHYTESDPNLHQKDISRNINVANKVKPGDWLVGYLPSKKIVGIGKVDRELFEDDTIDNGFDGNWAERIGLNEWKYTSTPVFVEDFKEVLGLILPNMLSTNAINEISKQGFKHAKKLLEDKFMKKPENNVIDKIKFNPNIILEGPPGTSKTYTAKKIVEQAMGIGSDYLSRQFSKLTESENPDFSSGSWDIVQFHPGYSYEDFVQGLTVKPGDQISFKREDKIFARMCQQAEKEYVRAHENNVKPPKFILIIDEINRGDLSKIFGELIYGLEYRAKVENGKYSPHRIATTYGGDLSIPDNLIIIGTMNTADRSIALIDFALRRRFAFYTLKPDEEMLIDYYESLPQEILNREKELREKALRLFKRINAIFNEKDGEAKFYAIGHTYFMVKSMEELNFRMETQVEKILQEYQNQSIIDVRGDLKDILEIK